MNLFDAHCDTITTLMEKGEALFLNNCHVDLKRVLNFDTHTQVFAIWLNPKYKNMAMEQTLKSINFFYDQLARNNDYITLVTKGYQLINNNKKIRAILSLEGGDAVDSIKDLDMFYRLGVRVLTLTWNHNNKIASGASDESNAFGLTDFGAKAIEKMNNLHMIIDVSHLSDKAFWDVDSITSEPYMASHSNARSLCDVKRNLTDDQIIKIANRGGVIGINLYPSFVKKTGTVTSDDIITHIDHIIKLTGDDHIGFGCDFDGIDNTPSDICNISDMDTIKNKLESKYKTSTVEKILYYNFNRFFCENLK